VSLALLPTRLNAPRLPLLALCLQKCVGRLASRLRPAKVERSWAAETRSWLPEPPRRGHSQTQQPKYCLCEAPQRHHQHALDAHHPHLPQPRPLEMNRTYLGPSRRSGKLSCRELPRSPCTWLAAQGPCPACRGCDGGRYIQAEPSRSLHWKRYVAAAGAPF